MSSGQQFFGRNYLVPLVSIEVRYEMIEVEQSLKQPFVTTMVCRIHHYMHNTSDHDADGLQQQKTSQVPAEDRKLRPQFAQTYQN